MVTDQRSDCSSAPAATTAAPTSPSVIKRTSAKLPASPSLSTIATMTPFHQDGSIDPQKLRPLKFPGTVHWMIEYAHNNSLEHLLCWDDDRTFFIRDPTAFSKEVLPLFFPKQTSFRSFERLLNMWGFVRLATSKSHQPGESERKNIVVASDGNSSDGSSSTNSSVTRVHDKIAKDTRKLWSKASQPKRFQHAKLQRGDPNMAYKIVRFEHKRKSPAVKRQVIQSIKKSASRSRVGSTTTYRPILPSRQQQQKPALAVTHMVNTSASPMSSARPVTPPSPCPKPQVPPSPPRSFSSPSSTYYPPGAAMTVPVAKYPQSLTMQSMFAPSQHPQQPCYPQDPEQLLQYLMNSDIGRDVLMKLRRQECLQPVFSFSDHPSSGLEVMPGLGRCATAPSTNDWSR